MSEKLKKEIKEWVKAFIFALVVGILMMIFARPSFVSGKSMMPTFKDGDLVLTERFSDHFSEPKKGEIVVALTDLLTEKGEKKHIIKRVIGTSGDRIIIKNNKVYVNGKELSENYLFEGSTSGQYEGVVPENHIFVMGDNREHSNDSRSDSVGYIALDKLRGRVYMRLYPFNSIATF